MTDLACLPFCLEKKLKLLETTWGGLQGVRCGQPVGHGKAQGPSSCKPCAKKAWKCSRPCCSMRERKRKPAESRLGCSTREEKRSQQAWACVVPSSWVCCCWAYRDLGCWLVTVGRYRGSHHRPRPRPFRTEFLSQEPNKQKNIDKIKKK